MRRGTLTFYILAIAAASFGQLPERLKLSDALAYGLKQSPRVAMAQAELSAARAKASSARGMQGPQMSLNAFATRSTMSAAVGSAMGVSPSTTALAPEGRWFDAGLMLMVPLYTGGTLSAMAAASAALEQAAAAGLIEMRSEIALDIRMAFVEATFAELQVRAEEDRLAAAKAMAQVARDLLAAGKGIEASVRRAEAEQAEAEYEVLAMSAEQKKMQLDLLLAIGAPLDSAVTLDSGSLDPLPVQSLEQMIELATINRGDIIAARSKHRRALEEVRAAEGSLRPQLYGFAMGDVFSPQDMMGRRSGGTLGLALSFPLVDGGQRRSAVAEAKAMVEQAKSDLKETERQVEVQVRKAWLDFETAKQRLATAERGELAALASHETQKVRVENGVGIFVDQLDAFAALTRARTNTVRAKLDVHLAGAKLYRAAGLIDLPNTTEVQK